MTTVNIRILETFRFDGKAPPFNILGHWGCAFSLCPKGGRIVPGDLAHKIKVDRDVDLIHPNCFVDMKKELRKQSIPFTVEDQTGCGHVVTVSRDGELAYCQRGKPCPLHGLQGESRAAEK